MAEVKNEMSPVFTLEPTPPGKKFYRWNRVPPLGWHRAVIAQIAIMKSKKGEPQLKMLLGIDANGIDAGVYHYVGLKPSGFRSDFLSACGHAALDQSGEATDFSEWRGLELDVKIKHEKEESGEVRARIDECRPVKGPNTETRRFPAFEEECGDATSGEDAAPDASQKEYDPSNPDDDIPF